MVELYCKLIREGLRTLDFIKDPNLKVLVAQRLKETDEA